LELFVSLDDIFKIFSKKLEELKNAVRDDMRHEKLKDLQTYYVCSYMKIMLELKSLNNTLYTEGYMS